MSDLARRYVIAIGMIVILLAIVTYDFLLAWRSGTMSPDTVLRDIGLIIAGGLVGRSTVNTQQGEG